MALMLAWLGSCFFLLVVCSVFSLHFIYFLNEITLYSKHQEGWMDGAWHGMDENNERKKSIIKEED